MRTFHDAQPRRGASRGRFLAAGLGVTLLLSACGGGDDPFEAGSSGGESASGSDETVTVAALGFTEALIMANMYVALLDDAGITAEIQEVENRELSAPALENGELDVSPEYAATAAEFYNLDANGPDAPPVATPEAAATVAALTALVEPRGLTVLEPAEAPTRTPSRSPRNTPRRTTSRR